jgi:hypothetical protein
MFLIPTLSPPPHPLGEANQPAANGQSDTFPILTPGGTFQVRYDAEAEVSHLGGVVPFSQFLKTSGLFDAWVADTPLKSRSNRALAARDVLGTVVLSALSGHYRFAHITAIRGDLVTPKVLGMQEVASEDTIRRALLRLVKEAADQGKSMAWLRRHLRKALDPLLLVPWTLDIDVTIKPVFGYQPGSVVGYNPAKPGRPSHALHSFVMAQTRLVLDVAVCPGDEHTATHTLPHLQRVILELPRDHWPKLLRGDCAFGIEDIMTWAETLGIDYLFKQKMTKNTKKLVGEIDLQSGWVDAGQGWEGKESSLQLSTWSRARRVVILRRPDPGPRFPRAKDLAHANQPKQEVLDTCLPYLVEGGFEYQVLVTTLTDDIPTIAQRYRDRADVENVFDEIKNHWGWGGFTSRTFAVTQAFAVMNALVYNWWSIFCRLADPNHHREAITTRPTLLNSIIRQTTHGNQTTLTISSTNGKKQVIIDFFQRVGRWLTQVTTVAEQWTSTERWAAMLKVIFAGPMGQVAIPTG